MKCHKYESTWRCSNLHQIVFRQCWFETINQVICLLDQSFFITWTWKQFFEVFEELFPNPIDPCVAKNAKVCSEEKISHLQLHSEE